MASDEDRIAWVLTTGWLVAAGMIGLGYVIAGWVSRRLRRFKRRRVSR
jgi:HAMP domain-containing protein